MFLTPKWARKVVGDLDNRKAHDILVRARTAAIFYFVVGLVMGSVVGFVLGSSNVMAAEMSAAEIRGFKLADAGTVSPKDQCHHKGVKRHWHKADKVTVGGPCWQDEDGQRWHLLKNRLCAKERVALMKEMDKKKNRRYKPVAKALARCVQNL